MPDGESLACDHDAGGKLTAARENGETAVAAFSYRSAERPAGQSVSGTQISYAHDSIFRLQIIRHDLVGTSTDQALTFA